MTNSAHLPTYIQINIYGKNLKELENNGIDVIQFLRGNGCNKVWIDDIPIYGVCPESGYDEQESEHNYSPDHNESLEASFSTSFVDFKYPPCSTPIYSKRWPSFKPFPTGASNVYGVEADEQENTLEIEQCAQEVIENIIQNVESQIGVAREAEFVSPTFRFDNESMNMKNIMSPTSVKQKVSVARRITNAHQKSIKKSNSRVVCETKLPLPRMKSTEIIPTTGMHSSTIALSEQNSERIYYELKPISLISHEDPNRFPFPRFSITESFFTASDQTDPITTVCDDENLDTSSQMEIYETNHDIDQTIQFDDFSKTGTVCPSEDEPERQPETNRKYNVKSTLSNHKKKVSFAAPRTRKNQEMEKIHDIKCYFQGCKTTYKWKKRYGKVRLIDHAFTHMGNQELRCSHCPFTTAGIRSIRYHHKAHHKKIPMTGFGMRSFVNSSNQNAYFAHIWNTCYENNRVAGLKPFERQDKGLDHHKKPKEGNTDLPFL
uniref:C2H2-type domain-containing protein n=1 Tax=Caenorhabditis japonica TaxID=281687 RepID=A0A8R1E973_CAEJA